MQIKIDTSGDKPRPVFAEADKKKIREVCCMVNAARKLTGEHDTTFRGMEKFVEDFCCNGATDDLQSVQHTDKASS